MSVPVTWHNASVGVQVRFLRRSRWESGLIVSLGRKKVKVATGRASFVSRLYSELEYIKR